MNTKYSLLFIFLILTTVSVFSQETGKKSRKERDLEKQKQTEALLNSKTFQFIASTAFTQGGRTIYLSSSPNKVVFTPDLISSDLPFFGRAYSGNTLNGPGGYTFEGKPDEYTIKPAKKGYEIKGVVKLPNDTYTLLLLVGTSGSANLTISSNTRSTMSYSGDISDLSH